MGEPERERLQAIYEHKLTLLLDRSWPNNAGPPYWNGPIVGSRWGTYRSLPIAR